MGYNSTKKDLFSLDCFGSEKKKKGKIWKWGELKYIYQIVST